MNRLARLAAIGLISLAPLAAGVASAQNAPSESQLAAAREVVRASGLARSFEAVPPTLFDQVRAQLVTRPEIKGDVEEIIVRITPQITARADDMVNEAARIFAAQIPEADLKQVAEFFKSPAGQKYVNALPAVMQDLAPRMQEWTEALSGVVVELIRNELQARGKSF
ncbi:DUF2059 domain-containing protein [Camelimonas abortus]|uniref:DUF2059 domain-containing protein n=1 Tax=Camelimonas abortus TaxID=1017184 RepID=A0ABV7LEU8_9HYPH